MINIVMDSNTVSSIVEIINHHSLVEVTKLLQWRLINRDWKRYIEEKTTIRSIIGFQKKIQQLLYIDSKIYDEYYYRRQVLRLEVTEDLPAYRTMTIPTVSWCLSDFEDENHEEKIYFVSNRASPREFKIFAQIYCHTPNIKTRIYPAKVISKIHIEQTAMLVQYKDNCRGTNILLFTPLCYSKHYRRNLKDPQYITVLCFVNVIDPDLDNDFPDEDERFIIFTLDVKDMSDREEHFKKLSLRINRITQSIMSRDNKKKIKEYIYPSNIAEKCQGFDKCFEELLTNQNYNL